MAIILKKTQRVKPGTSKENMESAPKKWYPVQHTLQLMDENAVAAEVADETTLNPAEALMAIRQLRKVVLRALLDGKSVKLGDWGTFQVRLSTEGADTKETLTAGNVKQVRINFQPGSEMKAALQKATFVWGESIVKGSSTSGGGSSDSGSTDSGNGGGTGSNPL
ncbi:MAG: HU family DNA-binding protein [Bacteroidaceae bacterium]|nr:HU family DNA-binding protein [Bacteroidaceae bacterium]